VDIHIRESLWRKALLRRIPRHTAVLSFEPDKPHNRLWLPERAREFLQSARFTNSSVSLRSWRKISNRPCDIHATHTDYAHLHTSIFTENKWRHRARCRRRKLTATSIGAVGNIFISHFCPLIINGENNEAPRIGRLVMSLWNRTLFLPRNFTVPRYLIARNIFEFSRHKKLVCTNIRMWDVDEKKEEDVSEIISSAFIVNIFGTYSERRIAFHSSLWNNLMN